MWYRLIGTFLLWTTVAVFAIAPGCALATVIGEASVQMKAFNDPDPTTMSVAIPWLATQYQTPTIDLNYSYAPAGATMYAAATVGVDLPFGISTGRMSTSAYMEAQGVTLSPKAWGSVRFEENLQVLSEILPVGTPVDVHLYALLSYNAVGGASGAKSSFGNDLTAEILGYQVPFIGWPYSNGFRYIRSLVGTGEYDFGDIAFRASVGDTVYVKFDLMYVRSLVNAAGYYDYQAHQVKPGSASSIISTVFAFGAEATATTAEGEAAPLALGAGQAVDDIVLFSPTLGGPFPGLEALDPANIAAHMLPIPEPGTLLLLASGLPGLAVLRRKSKSHLNPKERTIASTEWNTGCSGSAPTEAA